MANDEVTVKVTPYPISTREDLSAAFFKMNDRGWLGKIQMASPGGSQPASYFMVLEKAGETVNIKIGDTLQSIGDGVLMTQEKYDQLFG